VRLHRHISGQDAPPDIDLDILPPGALITQRLMEGTQTVAVFFQGGEQRGLWWLRRLGAAHVIDPGHGSGDDREHN
jgi:hypothetical protein